MKKSVPVICAHFVIILAVIIALGVASVVNGSTEAEGNEKFTGELETNCTLRILENDTAKEQGYLDALLTAFNEEYAEYGIVAVDANMDQYTDLETGGPYGYGPDVLYQANDSLMKYVDGKHIMPLPVEEMECYSYISDKAWDAYTSTVSGQEYVFGVPVNIQQPLLYYRKDLLPDNWEDEWDDDKDGIPDMVEYWTDLYRYSKQIKEESGGTKYGYMKSLNDGYFASGYFFSYGGYVVGGDDGRDTTDIVFSNGDGYLGGKIIWQLASVMNSECEDDSITKNAYYRLASGAYFATMTTPDVYSLFYEELVSEYESQGYTTSEAEALTEENLVVTTVPKLPVSGDLEDESQGFKEMTVMGGVNGYAVSSYTKYPNAALAFVEFATSYEMITTRSEMLGISPARSDVAEEQGGLNEVIYENLDNGTIYVMPSVRALSQVWTLLQTFCAILAADALSGDNVYTDMEVLKARLVQVDEQIYAAINTLVS
ncbi:MAG: extracellular solute-binding protein [Clostridia bacterium]|nr:extracellular solute-binding protein [Clostridia bacterium]